MMQRPATDTGLVFSHVLYTTQAAVKNKKKNVPKEREGKRGLLQLKR